MDPRGISSLCRKSEGGKKKKSLGEKMDLISGPTMPKRFRTWDDKEWEEEEEEEEDGGDEVEARMRKRKKRKKERKEKRKREAMERRREEEEEMLRSRSVSSQSESDSGEKMRCFSCLWYLLLIPNGYCRVWKAKKFLSFFIFFTV